MKHIPRKRFGQNFLTDEFVIDTIIAKINPQKSDALVEIGPGLGAMTTPFLQVVNKLSVIEIDRDLAQDLNNKNHPNLVVFSEDALKFDFNNLANNQKIRVVGNLPYNISTPLLFHLLGFKKNIKDMIFMLQKELVDRICAVPNNKIYGRLSVILQAQCTVEKLLTVPPEAFSPPPKVMSAVIKITPKKTVIDGEILSKVVKVSFAKRRKTLRNNLKSLVINNEELDRVPMDLGLRAENLSIVDFIKLTKYLEKIL